MKFSYKALKVKQTGSNKMLVFFSAPATEIDKWAGVPQKKHFGANEETVGFQREESSKRIDSLAEFCANEDNIIQNPLLCSVRSNDISSFAFYAQDDEDGNETQGSIVFEVPDYEGLKFSEILHNVREYLELRVPSLSEASPSQEIISRLKMILFDAGDLSHRDLGDQDTLEGFDEESPTDTGKINEVVEAESALFEESHIVDFWQEIACREEVIKLMDTSPEGDEFLGFRREALIAYLKPVVLVDGQHRLRGAIKAAENRINDPLIQEEIEEMISKGKSPDEVQEIIMDREARCLPVTLLLSDDPAEHVFQFVVVNQKATPIGRALLGTIISTSLSNDEMEQVASRIKSAGIPLEESQAVTYLARHKDSPFYNLIERGMVGDNKDLLQWGVFASLVNIFRDLHGGSLYGSKNDYSEIWKQRYLPKSEIVAKYSEDGFDSAFAYWRKLDGPWRNVFINFFAKVRDKFGDKTTVDAHNYWGRPRRSNLFNKVSLTILAADFFQYMVETKSTIKDASEVNDLVDSWLEDVAPNYFNRNWNLDGVKKDSTGIRNQWAYQWSEYRKNPVQLPKYSIYRVAKS